MRPVVLRSGAALLAAGLIDEMMFKLMPKGKSAGTGNRRKPRSKYMPHQGRQECARRVRQMQKLSLT